MAENMAGNVSKPCNVLQMLRRDQACAAEIARKKRDNQDRGTSRGANSC